jgi:arsenate reductase
MYLGYKIMDKSSVLFLCNGNAANSQIAEAFLRWYAGDYYEVNSAGLDAKEINPLTIQVMEEIGIDMSRQASKNLFEFIGKSDFAYTISLTGETEEQSPYFPGMGTRLSWKFEDPAAVVGSEEDQLAAFRKVRDQIEARILDWLAEQGVLVAN